MTKYCERATSSEAKPSQKKLEESMTVIFKIPEARIDYRTAIVLSTAILAVAVIIITLILRVSFTSNIMAIILIVAAAILLILISLAIYRFN